jgi:hypothetical protein
VLEGGGGGRNIWADSGGADGVFQSLGGGGAEGREPMASPGEVGGRDVQVSNRPSIRSVLAQEHLGIEGVMGGGGRGGQGVKGGEGGRRRHRRRAPPRLRYVCAGVGAGGGGKTVFSHVRMSRFFLQAYFLFLFNFY